MSQGFTPKGLGVALVTPFKPDFSIDFEALAKIVNNICDGEADFIVVLGTTAEAPTLSEQEAEQVRRFVYKEVAGRLPLVLGLGGNCTADVIHRLKTTNLEGFEAILSVCPFYNKPNQEGMYRHFKSIAEASPLPVILYNVPGRTGVNLLPKTTIRLAHDCPNIIATKEASGSVAAVTEIVAGAPEGFSVLSGDDALTLPMMAVGATGVISVIGNLFTVEFADLVHWAESGNYEDAMKRHKKFSALYKLMFAEGNPAGIKCALAHEGFCHNVLRLPLVPVGNICSAEIAQAISSYYS